MKPCLAAPSPFLSGPILSPLIRFALPLMLSQLLQALYGGVDLAVVGHFSTTESVSAVATGSQVMQTVTAIVTGLTMGVTVLLGKAVGARDEASAGSLVAGQIKLFSLLAVVLTAVMLLLAPQAARWMNVPEGAVGEAVDYIRICSAGMVFITAYNGISGIFRGLGNSRSPFLFVLVACLVNVVLDLVLVGLVGMGAAGAALATVIAQASSVVFSLAYMARRPFPFRLDRASFRGNQSAGKILRVGGPIALQDFLVNISFLMITSIVNALGLVASAGVGISEKLYVFLSIIPMAFMSALSAFVAQNMGAEQPRRALRALCLAQGIAFAFGMVMFYMTFCQGAVLASLFDRDPQVVEATAVYLRGISWEYLMIPLTYCFLGYFNGRERTNFVMLQGILSVFLVRVPLSYFLSRLPDTGLALVSLAVPISGLVNLLLCLGYFLWLSRLDRRRAEAA